MSLESFYFFFLLLWRRGEKKIKIIISKAYQSSNNDTTDVVGKISRIWIQWHQWMLSTMIRVCHTSHLKANEPWYIWITLVSHSDYCWWPFLISLDLFHQIFPTIFVVFSRVLIYLHRMLLFSFLIFLFFLFYYCKLFQWCFLKYFFCTVFFFKFWIKKKKETPKLTAP